MESCRRSTVDLSSRAEIARNPRRPARDTPYIYARRGLMRVSVECDLFAGGCVHSYGRLVILIDVGRGTDGADQPWKSELTRLFRFAKALSTLSSLPPTKETRPDYARQWTLGRMSAHAMATMREQCRVTTRRFREGANWRHAKDVDSMQTCFALGTTRRRLDKRFTPSFFSRNTNKMCDGFIWSGFLLII